ncbi:hypothetical protein [Leptospira bandrabouensis]|uniref:Uncharacterized protein n=1 Tax=Leptospira bandrabouensis TaxID=2484903 RepID=A0A6H3NQY3_9LEPT|nr:hypothetical protein [Leptospira bandrabouensis]TGN09970.1 hypothetical protein EHR07_00390 [Leptospira bandrabouensis]TGN12372.1 hypothetical protein EHR08_13400 [Leptospira bandrabouensis]
MEKTFNTLDFDINNLDNYQDPTLKSLLDTYFNSLTLEVQDEHYTQFCYDKVIERINFLEDNKRYNENFNLYINECTSQTETLIRKYDHKRKVQYSLTPKRFISNIITQDPKKLLNPKHQINWIRAYIVRSIRSSIPLDLLKNELKKAISEEIYGSILPTLEEEYLALEYNVAPESNSFLGYLSILHENSFLIDFEKLFGRSASSVRALYQALCLIAENNGSKTILFESFKNLSLKTKTKIGHATIKKLLILMNDKGVITVVFTNKEKNEELKTELALRLKKKEITLDEYNFELKKGIKPEYLESIVLKDNSHLVTLKNKVTTPFFKSELLNIKSLGKRGNELFWLIQSNPNGMTMDQIYSLFPNLKNKTNSLRDKVNQLVFLRFLRKENNRFIADTHDFILKIEKAKELDVSKAEKRKEKPSNYIFEKHKADMMYRMGEHREEVIQMFSDENIKKVILENKKQLKLLGRYKNGLTEKEFLSKINKKTTDYIYIDMLFTLGIIDYNPGTEKHSLNRELFKIHTNNNNREVRIPHQNGFGHFLEKQVSDYERDRRMKEKYQESFLERRKFQEFEKMIKEGVPSRKSAEIVDARDEHLNEPGSFSMVQWLKENVG